MKINAKIIIIGLVLLSIIITGCEKTTNKPTLDVDCGTLAPGNNDECCENKFAGTEVEKCVGDWKYVGGEQECLFLCRKEEKLQTRTIDKDYCETDDDCGCGISLETGDCYVGFRDYIKQGTFELPNNPGICANYCYGELGNLEIKCVENKCIQQ